MNTIVVGYDGTEAAERALARAGDIAKAFGSSVVVTSVSSVMTGTAHGGGSVDPTDAPDEHDALLSVARGKLAEQGVEADIVLGVGDPAEAIVELAEERGADLIVRRDARTGLLGSSPRAQRERRRPAARALRRADRALTAAAQRRAERLVWHTVEHPGTLQRAIALHRRATVSTPSPRRTSSSAPASTGSRPPTTSRRSCAHAAPAQAPTWSSSTSRSPAQARPGSRAASCATTTSSPR